MAKVYGWFTEGFDTKDLQATIVPTVTAVLRMATVDGARLPDMSDQIGSLTPGKKADVIILDPGAVNFAPWFDAISQIVFNAQPQNVEWVFVDGRAAVEPCCPFFKIDPILCERGPHCIYANLAGLTLAGRKLSVTQVKPTI